MKRLQLIFCVETNQQSDTDFLYIFSTIKRFYDIGNGYIQIKPVYLEGKSRYSSNRIKRKIDTLMNQFNAESNKEAKAFVSKKAIEKIDKKKLTAREYLPHFSNICLVLDQMLTDKS